MSQWPPIPLPKTIEEAVRYLILTLSEQEGRRIGRMSKEELLSLHHDWGAFIRNSFGMWGDNRDLLEACGSPAMHPDSASAILIQSVWTLLRHIK
jgi:hypothetical protein